MSEIKSLRSVLVSGSRRLNKLGSTKSRTRRNAGDQVETLEVRVLPAAVNLTAVADGFARDTNRDGIFDQIDTTNTLAFGRHTTGKLVGIERTLIEFNMAQISTALTVNSAVLEINVSEFTKSGGALPVINVYGYVGNGVITMADATATGTLIGTATVTAKGVLRIQLDTEYIRSQGGTILGLRLENPVLNGGGAIFNTLESTAINPTLKLDVSLDVPDKTFNIDEQRPNGTLVGSIRIGNNATYAITGGNAGGIFAVNPTTGDITVAKSSLMTFASQSKHVLTLQTTLPNGTVGLSTVTVNVKNVFGPNNLPIVTASQFTLEEYSAVGTVVGTVLAEDPDSADPISFSLIGGNDGNAFAINAVTGQITVINQQALSRRDQTSFVLQVAVRDTRSPQSLVVQEILVILTPRVTVVPNSNAPSLLPIAEGQIRDLNSDGVYENVLTTGNTITVNRTDVGVPGNRGVLEYSLNGLGTNKIVKNARLTIYVSGGSGTVSLEVYGSTGNGSVTTTDAVLGTLIGQRDFTLDDSGDYKAYTIELDRVLIQQLLSSSGTLSIGLRSEATNGVLIFDSSKGPANNGDSLARRPTLDLTLADPTDDVVLVNTTSGALTVARSNGSGFTILKASQLRKGITFTDQMSGDFNGDGRIDLVGRNSANGQILVSLATANQFITGSAWTTYTKTTNFSGFAVGDFNGDGLDDIVGRSAEGHLVVAQSTGKKFENKVFEQLPAHLRNLTDVAVGDFNGDGRDDLIGRVAASGQIVVSISTGTSFTSTVWGNAGTAANLRNVAIGDFNGDGKSDVALLLSNGTLQVMRSTGTSFEAVSFGTVPGGAVFSRLLTGDFNGDGRDDLLGVETSGALTIFRSTGNSFLTVAAGTLPAGALASEIMLGDFNRDGATDIVSRTTLVTTVKKKSVTTQQLFVSTGNGSGPFSSTLFSSFTDAGPLKMLALGNF